MFKDIYSSMYNQIRPSDNLISSVLNRTANKRSPDKRALLVAAIIAGLLATTITAFAVGSYLGAFDRLREIIGDERADMLQPVEVSNVVGELIIGDGIRIELVAVGVTSNVVDFFFTLEDVVGNRLDGDIRIIATVLPIGGRQHETSVGSMPEVINRADDGTITLHSRETFSRSIVGEELRFFMIGVSFNERSAQHEVDFDFSALMPQAPAAWLWGMPILPPDMHGIELELEGFDNIWQKNVSNIGLIDGRLHIQLKSEPLSQTSRGSSQFFLVDPRGETVIPYVGSDWPFGSLNFRVDDNGNIINNDSPPHTGDGFVHYWEYIYEVDVERLSEYRLVGRAFTEDWIDLRWAVNFEVDIPSERADLVADGLNILLECCSAILREVRVTQSHVLLSADYIEVLAVSPNPQVVVNTTEGVVTPNTRTGFSNVFEEINSPPVGFTIVRELVEVEGWDLSDVDFLDLDSVVSVEIAGHTISFR